MPIVTKRNITAPKRENNTKAHLTLAKRASEPARMGPIAEPKLNTVSYEPVAIPSFSDGKWRKIRFIIRGNIVAEQQPINTKPNRKPSKPGKIPIQRIPTPKTAETVNRTFACRPAGRVVKENIWASILVKGGFAVLALMGLVSLWMAVAVGDMGLSLAVILNAMRLALIKPRL